MKRTLTTLLLGPLLIACVLPSYASRCEESKQINHRISAEQLTRLKVNALAGSLDIEGSDGEEIVVQAYACADEKEYLDQMTIDIDESDNELNLTVMIPYHKDGWYADYAYMDIQITVPERLATEIKDSSGDLEVEGANITLVDDSSGNIRLSDLTGNLRIRDSSGDVSIRSLKGDINITDSSGLLDIRDIEGNVYIPQDSSGDIEIDTVSGIVSIERDGSGSIEIENVVKDVRINSDGSGDIRVSDVDGSVKIGSDGSGNVRVNRVEGDFVLEAKGSGEVRNSDIKGKVYLPHNKYRS